MAYTTLTVGSGWPGAAQFTAAAATSIDIPNPWGLRLYFITTEDDTAPTFPVDHASLIRASERDGRWTLQTGERLWIAAPQAGADLSVILHYSEA